MKKIVILLFVTAVLISCGNDNNLSDSTKIDLITGVNLTNQNGLPVGVQGNPNTYLNGGITVFPSPFQENLVITTGVNFKNVWVIKGLATKDFQDTDFSLLLDGNTYSALEVSSVAVSSYLDLSTNNLTLNLSGLNDGYYRVFVQFEDDTFSWVNVSKGSINNFWQ